MARLSIERTLLGRIDMTSAISPSVSPPQNRKTTTVRCFRGSAATMSATPPVGPAKTAVSPDETSRRRRRSRLVRRDRSYTPLTTARRR